MPVYFVLTKSKLDQATKHRVAKGITDVHCNTTGAPSEFVNVVFMTGYRLKGGYKAAILGNVRKGGNRTDESIGDLRSLIHQEVVSAFGLTNSQVNTEFLPFDAAWAWEGGEVLPYPGEETSWFARKNKKKENPEGAYVH